MLELRALSFDYHDKPLLKNINFSLAVGQLMHLRGNNGSGKTTLMRLIAGLLQPEKGDIYYKGVSIQQDLPSYQQQLCYVGHRAGINPLLTVKENCFLDLHWQRREIGLDELLASFGLEQLADQPCFYLSAGQRRRVGLLRLAMTDARLWLLDEPLTALDNEAITDLMCLLESHLTQGGQVILTSHQTLPLEQVDYQEYFL